MRGRDKPYFVGYSRIEDGYYTKTTLRNEYGLKPLDATEYDAIARLYIGNRWGEYLLYKPENCVEIKRRKVKEVELTDENIAQALYIINKSAKVSRDTKRTNYEERRHSVVAASKTRENKLYALKDAVLQKLDEQNKLEIIGYHEMFGSKYLVTELKGFSFHQPIKYDIELSNLKYLGELESPISSEKTIKTSINFSESQNLLMRYLEIDISELDYETTLHRRMKRSGHNILDGYSAL